MGIVLTWVCNNKDGIHLHFFFEMEDEIGTVRIVGFNDVATRFFKEETIA